MRRAAIVLAVAIVAALGVAPASAHEEINPSTFPTGKPVFFLLNAANEQKVDLVKMTLNAPDNLPFGATTKPPPGWNVDASEKVITYSGGTVAPDTWEQWGFEIDGADQPGTYTYKVTLGFADGKTDDVSVPVTAVGATGTSPPSTTVTITVPTTRATATAPLSARATDSIHNVRTRANTALAIGIIAAVLALVAIVAALVRRSRSGPPTGAAAPAADGPDASATQNW